MSMGTPWRFGGVLHLVRERGSKHHRRWRRLVCRIPYSFCQELRTSCGLFLVKGVCLLGCVVSWWWWHVWVVLLSWEVNQSLWITSEPEKHLQSIQFHKKENLQEKLNQCSTSSKRATLSASTTEVAISKFRSEMSKKQSKQSNYSKKHGSRSIRKHSRESAVISSSGFAESSQFQRQRSTGYRKSQLVAEWNVKKTTLC